MENTSSSQPAGQSPSDPANQPVPGPANQPAPKKTGGSSTAIIIIVVIIVVLAAIGGLGYWACRKFVANPIKDAGDGKVKIGDVSVDASKNPTWPSDLPSYVPKFSGGKIEGAAKLGNTWTITISGLTENDFNNYKTALKNAGWTVDAKEEVNLGDLKTFIAKNSQNYTVTCSLTDDQNKAKAALVTVSLEDSSKQTP